MQPDASARAERLYLSYLARIRQLRAALHHQDSETLRSLELEFPSLSFTERAIVAMAVHDVSASLPRRAKAHFVRTLRAEQADEPEKMQAAGRRHGVEVGVGWRPRLGVISGRSHGERHRRPPRLLPGASRNRR